MKKIAYTRPDGGTSIIVPADKTSLERVLGTLSDAEYEAEIRKAIPADATNVVDVDESDLPEDREFRDAWKQVEGNTKIDFDLDKAKDIQLDRIRKIRDPKLAVLDVDYVKADEAEDITKKDEIRAEKQRLRDITEPLKALEPTSIDEIKAAFPEEFKEPVEPVEPEEPIQPVQPVQPEESV